jgi:hypothetical protein
VGFGDGGDVTMVSITTKCLGQPLKEDCQRYNGKVVPVLN